MASNLQRLPSQVAAKAVFAAGATVTAATVASHAAESEAADVHRHSEPDSQPSRFHALPPGEWLQFLPGKFPPSSPSSGSGLEFSRGAPVTHSRAHEASEQRRNVLQVPSEKEARDAVDMFFHLADSHSAVSSASSHDGTDEFLMWSELALGHSAHTEAEHSGVGSFLVIPSAAPPGMDMAAAHLRNLVAERPLQTKKMFTSALQDQNIWHSFTSNEQILQFMVGVQGHSPDSTLEPSVKISEGEPDTIEDDDSAETQDDQTRDEGITHNSTGEATGSDPENTDNTPWLVKVWKDIVRTASYIVRAMLSPEQVVGKEPQAHAENMKPAENPACGTSTGAGQEEPKAAETSSWRPGVLTGIIVGVVIVALLIVAKRGLKRTRA